MPPADRSETTRRQLCLSAEGLVATEGLSMVTLRRVAMLAGQRNTAAVSYHFGSTERLLRAVVAMRLRDTEADRQRMIAESGPSIDALDAFAAWRCLAWPPMMLPDEQAPHAHIHFLMHMSTGGLLSNPFDGTVPRSGVPSVGSLLERLRFLLSPLPPAIGRARIALCGMMFWNAVVLYDKNALGPDGAAFGLSPLLADVERLTRRILIEPAD